MKVLVADDDRLSRTIVVRGVVQCGYEVVVASDGEEAWKLLKSDPEIRVAVLDWMMPGLDGVEICARLLESLDRSGVYTILLTARDEVEDLLYALGQGAHIFLSKPVSMPVLQAHIKVGKRLVEAEDKLVMLTQELERIADERAKKLVVSEELARTDPLTGALNRRGFSEKALPEYRRAARNNRPLALLKIDIDHFKKVNDTFGHDAGDKVLQAVVSMLENGVREIDLVGRMGGEEFEVLLPETNGMTAFVVAERFRRAVEALHVKWHGHSISLTTSVGVAALRCTDTSFPALQARSDVALYEAKGQGRNRVVGPADGAGLPFGDRSRRWVQENGSAFNVGTEERSLELRLAP
ncbi:MAG: diguanylate cyclase [Thermoanaerobaculales bacterium]|nr:diguanylate cyclase [Thermoanaerobaculales bacterium]